MSFDFAEIRGPEHSREENFSSLCSRLIMELNPSAKAVAGAGGDEGVDTFVGEFNGVCDVFQHKFFLQTLKASQRRQIEESLTVALDHHNVRSWTLVLPKDLTPAEIRWFGELRVRYPKVQLDWWGKAKLAHLLATYPGIARDYSPLPTVFNIVVGHEAAQTKTKTSEVLEILQRAAEKAGLSPEPNVMNSAAEEISRRSVLKVLIWGPGANGGALYKKRIEVRDVLRVLGHTADFSEDVWTPTDLLKSGLNLSVAEFLQAAAYDYIVCLMTSAGSIGEVHDFARERVFAAKMMICVDAENKEGYASAGVLRIFEGYNGKLDWFQTPIDLRKCHLRKRIVEQVQKVSERKQWEIATGRAT